MEFDLVGMFKRYSSLQYFRNVSLRIKLLGLYFFGLALLGIVGYGFFVYLEVENYTQDRKDLQSQAHVFEEMAFKHLKYTIDLNSHLNRIYNKSGEGSTGSERSILLNDFIKGIAALSDENCNFAIFDYLGTLIATNDNRMRDVLASTTMVSRAISELSSNASKSGIYTEYLELTGSDGTGLGFYVNAIHFEPLNYCVLAIAKNGNVQSSIEEVMLKKKRVIINSVAFSLLLGFCGTSLVLTILFFYLRSLTLNISEVTRSIKKLSSGETTDVFLKAANEDEVGMMIAAFNGYVQKKAQLERFKQLIEEDENILDVYGRIFSVLERFGVKNYALYEVKNSKNHIKHIRPESLTPELLMVEDYDELPMPCSQEILFNADACRAKRLAQVISGDSECRVCPRYLGYDEGGRHLCIPIIISGSAGDIVHITVKPEDEETLRQQTPIILEYFRNAAPVIESKKLLGSLKEATLRDNMTGLNNRRFLEEYVEVLISETERDKKDVGILMADLDFFKKVNDVHGHQVGDKVLKILAKIMRNSVRSSDIVIRYGGEEFLLIIKKASGDDDVMAVAEKIRRNVEEYVMKIDSAITLQKTLTIGVSLFPNDCENFWQAVKFADVALYRGKESGRNKVVRFEESMWDAGEEY